MKRLAFFFSCALLCSSAFAAKYENFYTACVNFDTDAVAAMRWIHAYYDLDGSPQKHGSHKLECGKAYAYLANTTVLKLNYDPSKLQCPDANCKLHSMEFVRYFDNLQSIELNGHRITDLSPVQNLSNLVYLSLEDNLITDISPLLQQTDDANTLQVLNLHENLISDITPAQHLLQLKGLDVSRNRLTQLPDLSMLRHLNLLSINFNHISDLSGVANNPKLHVLEMSNMGAVSLASLGQVLEHLTFLDAHFNQLNDIRPLELAERLVELDLTKNNLSDIKTLNVLPKIKHVEIGGNQITYAQCMDMLAPRSDREHLCSSIKRWDDQF